MVSMEARLKTAREILVGLTGALLLGGCLRVLFFMIGSPPDETI